MAYELPSVHPFHDRLSWHGEFLCVDGADGGCPTDEKPIKAVVWSESSGSGWDGECAAICLLDDGCYIAWETFWGPTGDGFCENAYGGDATIIVASNLRNAVVLGLSDEARKRAATALGLSLED